MNKDNETTTTMTRREIESTALDFSKPNTPFSEILLNGDRNVLTQSLKDCGWTGVEDNNTFEVKVVFNGIDVSVIDFNTIVGDWWSRAEAHIKEQTRYYQSKEAAEKLAKEMVQVKLDQLQEAINSLQNNFECLQSAGDAL